jgi:hypothetical protein
MRPGSAACALFVLVAAAAVVVGCSAGARAQPSAAGTAAPNTPAPVTSGGSVAPTPAPSGAPTAPSPSADAVAFFRAQESPCREHAEEVGDPPAEPERFAGAKQVSDLGDGAALVEDGRGTRLVVRPAEGVVLPASGRATDPMPPPYGSGCPEDVFAGAADG